MILTRLDGNKYRIETGLPWGYLDYVDIFDSYIESSSFGEYYYTNLMYENLHPVDIIPMFPTVSTDILKKLKNAAQNNELTEEQQKQLSHILNFLYKPDYEKGINHYNNLLKMYGLVPEDYTISYIRVYATDNTQLSESITSNYEEIPVKQLIDSLGDKIRTAFGGAIDLFRQISKSTYLTPDDISSLTKELGSSNNFFDAIIQAADAGARGLKIDFPKVWTSTSYNRTLNLNISFSSPYGHPKVLFQWVYAPLLALLLLGSPLNIYGFTGLPLYVRVKAYGQFDVVLGAIQSITINRGGQNTVYNKYKQPMKMDVTITIIDLYSQFSAEYTQLKDNPMNSEELLTEPINSENFNPIKEKIISSQPTVGSLINSLRPFKDASIPNNVSLTQARSINKNARFSFTRRRIK